MNVDLPTPGMPVRPTRTAFPVRGSNFSMSLIAFARWSLRLDSIRVMALPKARTSPAATLLAKASYSGEIFGGIFGKLKRRSLFISGPWAGPFDRRRPPLPWLGAFRAVQVPDRLKH